VAALGGFIIFVGFLAFNGGTHIFHPVSGGREVVSMVVMNTLISCSSSALTAMYVHKSINVVRHQSHYWSLLVTINGGLAGKLIEFTRA